MKNRLIFFIVMIMFFLSGCGGGDSGGPGTSVGPDVSDVRDSVYCVGRDSESITIGWDNITDAGDNPG